MAPKRARAGDTAGSDVAPFGKHGSEAVRLITLRLGRMTVKVSTFGATITSLAVPSALGEPTETVLGFAEHKPYESCPYFGCTVGRFANRIAKGSFTLEGKPIQLPACNDRGNHLHGGARGWDKRVWELVEASATACTLKLRSEDGDEGYPGNVDATVSFTLEWPSQIAIEYDLTTDAPTVVNPTNHSYFNLSDGGATDVLDHDLMVFADKYLPTDATCIPTGELKPVSGPMDLRRPTPIFRGIHAADGGNGYDHNYVLAAEAGAHEDGRRLRRAAWVRSPKTGIELLVLTTEPGIQVCASNHLDGTCTGHAGRVYGPNAGLCLETQHYPDSVNHAHFPSTVLKPGHVFSSRTVYAFSASASSTEHA